MGVIVNINYPIFYYMQQVVASNILPNDPSILFDNIEQARASFIEY